LTPEPASLATSVSVAPLLTATVTLNGEDADDAATPVPLFVGDAVSLRLSAAVLMMMPENVARPDGLVLAVAPEAIVFADGLRVMEKLLADTLFP